MTTTAPSIDPTAFAEAITELPLSAVYSKISELRNSIAHLYRSNSELRLFLEESQDTEEEKKELEGYILENEGVVTSINVRVSLLKTELEKWGQPWVEGEEREDGDGDRNAETQDHSESTGAESGTGTSTGNNALTNGSGSGSAGQDDGVYL
ncbi:hypothetical protein N7478_007257 [Penicillium angulare]|uniref:uncharacterized protein n=1 Tax=Penicillium angulare TaxID=116970 RepID=UPI0025414320|nr:uncharacterized protein N7478_007257 [Penicillium angulare]KAJ5281885.1 hypothetical protein N7478_007257 [Penicillium angulare]